MSSPNVFISNGTCYYAAGKESAPEFIPCGNDYFGHKPCCQGGDLCLLHNACYNNQFGVTYLAGCSDPTYEDESCPNKEGFDQTPWVGLVYCNGTSDEWIACNQAAAEPTLTKPDACFCPESSRTVAINAGKTLSYEASLPTATGETPAWQPGYIPTVSTTSASTSSTYLSATTITSSFMPTQTSIGTASSSSSTAVPASSGGSSLSIGAQAGIGVGASLAGLFILAVLAFLYLRRRQQVRRQRELEAATGGARGADGDAEAEAKFGLGPSSVFGGGTPGTTLSELEPRAARPWSLRSELAGSQAYMPYRPDIGDVTAAATNGSNRESVGSATGSFGSGEPGYGGGGQRGSGLEPVLELPG